jgi:hypothetical protein
VERNNGSHLDYHALIIASEEGGFVSKKSVIGLPHLSTRPLSSASDLISLITFSASKRWADCTFPK